jgi:hypothetical protein
MTNEGQSIVQLQTDSGTPAVIPEPPPWLTGLHIDIMELAREPAIQVYCSAAYFAWRNEVRLRLWNLLSRNMEWREVVMREFDSLTLPGPVQDWPARLMVIGNYLSGLLFTLGHLGRDLEFDDARAHKPHLGFHVPVDEETPDGVTKTG